MKKNRLYDLEVSKDVKDQLQKSLENDTAIIQQDLQSSELMEI